MLIEDFIKKNFFHDSSLLVAEYNSHEGTLSVKISQSFSELSIENQTGVKITPDDIVEVDILLEGIKHISKNMSLTEDNEIYDVIKGVIGEDDIIMIQLLIDRFYSEVYIRGNNITVKATIIGIHSC